MDDCRIVELYWQRQESAITETQKKYGKYCYAIAYQILQNREDAQESVNDTYFSAWESIPPQRPQVFSTFLGKITRNLSLKKWRAKTAQKRGGGEVALTLEELEECVPAKSMVEEEAELHRLVQVIEDFLRKLSEEERNIFLCRYWYFDSVRSIARRFDCGESKIKMKLMRTREKLKRRLEEEDFAL